jgi:hypothetical protein
VRFAFFFPALALVGSCETPPAFPVPAGPAKPIALDVELPVAVLGRWTVNSFSDTLRAELVKYNITVVDPESQPGLVALIDLGRFTYRDWQEIDVALTHDDGTTPLGRIRVLDLSATTLDVAAQPVAALIARWVWTAHAPPSTPKKRPPAATP